MAEERASAERREQAKRAARKWLSSWAAFVNPTIEESIISQMADALEATRLAGAREALVEARSYAVEGDSAWTLLMLDREIDRLRASSEAGVKGEGE